MKADKIRELKRLTEENRRLKKLVADQALTSRPTKRLRRETGEPFAPDAGGRDASGSLAAAGAKG
jgi:hypothetical protein